MKLLIVILLYPGILLGTKVLDTICSVSTDVNFCEPITHRVYSGTLPIEKFFVFLFASIFYVAVLFLLKSKIHLNKKFIVHKICSLFIPKKRNSK